jgi:hypothetical protein
MCMEPLIPLGETFEWRGFWHEVRTFFLENPAPEGLTAPFTAAGKGADLSSPCVYGAAMGV